MAICYVCELCIYLSWPSLIFDQYSSSHHFRDFQAPFEWNSTQKMWRTQANIRQATEKLHEDFRIKNAVGQNVEADLAFLIRPLPSDRVLLHRQARLVDSLWHMLLAKGEASAFPLESRLQWC